MHSSRSHFINSCFPVANIGGQSSVMDREATLNRDKTIVCIAPDTEPITVGNIEYRSADALQPGKADRWDLWFGVGLCQLTFPEAYIAPSASIDAVRAMLAADSDRDSQHDIGTMERLLEYADIHAQNFWEQGRNFTQRFERQLGQIPAGSVLNWQSFFMEPAINDYAEDLRKNGVAQTFHLHESLPDSLHRSLWGRSFLNAMTRVDAVYLHTDEFIRRLEVQLELGRKEGWILSERVPEIRRFDLGVDLELIREGANHVTRDNFRDAIPNWGDLDRGQQQFIEEVFGTQEKVPHRFMCVDRIDPVKGIDVVLGGIDTFLEKQLAAGMSALQLRDSFRFFFLQKPGNAAEGGPYNTAARYNEYAEGVFQRVQQKYPGIIHRGDPLGGAQRLAVFSLMRGCHGITGGTTEGLNLSIMENAKVNEGEDTSIICGNGAGFAMQVEARGRRALAHFPQAGDAAGFRDAIDRIVYTQANHPGLLGRDKQALVRHEIDTRSDSVIVGLE
jgi:hypothetical protein